MLGRCRLRQNIVRLFSTKVQKITKKLDSPTEQQDILRQELNTYLQIITPKEAYQMVEQKERNTAQVMQKLKELGSAPVSKQLEKDVDKHVLRYSRFLSNPQIKDICRLASVNESSIVQRVYRKVVGRLERHVEILPIEDLVDLVYTMAKVNKKEPAFMKAVEDKIIEEGLPLQYPLLRKAFFAYTHLNVGTTTLYSSMARTVKIGQHELDPLELAQLANYLSRVQDNAQGGFGLYAIAEGRLEPVVNTMAFQNLVTISEFMLSQNLGSNYLQLKIQTAILNKFPLVDEKFNINHLVRLLKSTSGYFFKIRDNSLIQEMQNATIKLAKFATTEQLEQIVWSWSRSLRGSKQLWQTLQAAMIKKAPLLNIRGICFTYSSFSRIDNVDSILDVLELRFNQQENIKLHYKLKMLQGMVKRHPIKQQFVQLCQQIVNDIGKLTNKDLINLLAVINDSDLHYESSWAADIKKVLMDNQKSIREMLPFYKLSQLIDILFLWTKMDIQNEEFVDQLIGMIQDVQGIPKKTFIKAFFCLIVKGSYDRVAEFMKIIYLLREFGPIGYFFPPQEYPLLTYAVYQLAVNGRMGDGSRLHIEKWLLDQLQEYMGKLEYGILNDFEAKVHDEAKNLIDKWKEQSKDK